MRILIINDYEEYGGAEIHIRDLTKILRKEGHEVCHFFVNRETNRNPNKFIYYFHHNWFNIRLYKKLKDYIKKINPDIIYFHNNYFYTNSTLMACKGYKVIQKVCDYGIMCPTAWGVKKNDLSGCDCKSGLKCGVYCLPFPMAIFSYTIPDIVRKRIIKRSVNTFIAPALRMKETLENNGFRNVVYLPNFKIKDDWERKNDWGMNNNDGLENEKIVLFAGTLQKHKGSEYLIKAMVQVINEIKDAKLIIAGKGPERARLSKLYSKYKDNIIFVGKIDNDKLREYYEKANVVVISSIFIEQFNNVCIEAMALGRPIILSKIGVQKEFVKDNVNGFTYERFDIDDLAKKIMYLLKNPKISEKMGQEGRRLYLENLTERIYMIKLNEILEN